MFKVVEVINGKRLTTVMHNVILQSKNNHNCISDRFFVLLYQMKLIKFLINNKFRRKKWKRTG